MDGQTPEHFIEVLLNAQDRAADESDAVRRNIWLTTVRDIETILADQPAEIGAARGRLATRTDPEGRRMYAYVRDLLQTYDDAEREAKAVIERARKG